MTDKDKIVAQGKRTLYWLDDNTYYEYVPLSNLSSRWRKMIQRGKGVVFQSEVITDAKNKEVTDVDDLKTNPDVKKVQKAEIKIRHRGQQISVCSFVASYGEGEKVLERPIIETTIARLKDIDDPALKNTPIYAFIHKLSTVIC